VVVRTAMQIAVDHEAVTPPIDLTTAQAIEIADYLRPRVKEPDTVSCFECPFSGRVWLETLHFLPQAFIQSSRSAGQPAKDDKFTDHFNSKLADLFPMTTVGTELPYGRRLKKRADLFVAGMCGNERFVVPDARVAPARTPDFGSGCPRQSGRCSRRRSGGRWATSPRSSRCSRE
jgi:hypothetical protein